VPITKVMELTEKFDYGVDEILQSKQKNEASLDGESTGSGSKTHWCNPPVNYQDVVG